MENKVKSLEKQEYKDKVYLLHGQNQPPVLVLGSRHSRRKPLLWFDESVGHQRELRYATNQHSPFKDEQKGVSTLGHIVFRNGRLVVPKSKQNLQTILNIQNQVEATKRIQSLLHLHGISTTVNKVKRKTEDVFHYELIENEDSNVFK